jgi:hypothetical protein
MTDDTETSETDDKGTDDKQEQKFTADEVAQIVKDRLAQQAKNKFGDYDDLKAKAGDAKTAEERIAALEADLTATKTDATRARIAARFGINTEGKDGKPSDADLFLTGTDEDSMTAQAQRLVARETDRKKQGNIAPKEGESKSEGAVDSELREFAGQLFGSAD